MNPDGWSQDDRASIAYFDDLIDQHGVDPRALDWGSRESQRLRFRVIAGVGPLEGASLLDVGCGQGDFLAWLDEQGIRADYTGVDITPRMIEVARSRFPAARFEVRNLQESPVEERSYDYVVASGIFYLRKTEPVAFLKATVEQLFRACRRAVVFNSLSSWAGQRDSGEFYADPLETLAFCRTLSPKLAIRHDYHPRDFTAFLYK
jgi:SAM-dependent methyltransferase